MSSQEREKSQQFPINYQTHLSVSFNCGLSSTWSLNTYRTFYGDIFCLSI